MADKKRDRKFMVLASKQRIRDKIACAVCGNVLNARYFEVDHIVPKAKGGSDDVDNSILLCSPCNKAKNDRLIELSDLRAKLKENGQLEDEALAIRVERDARAIAQFASKNPDNPAINDLRESPRHASAWLDFNMQDLVL